MMKLSRLTLRAGSIFPFCKRSLSLSPAVYQMKAWVIHQYGRKEELSLSSTINQPVISHPDDILVEVYAASINPLDVKMRDGYGKTFKNALNQTVFKQRNTNPEFPLILGRDFSGVILETGRNVTRYKSGDEVWGATLFTQQGSFAQYTTVRTNDITLKPSNLSHTEAASIPYVGITSWNALCSVGGLRKSNTNMKRVLVLGGSGGIGTFSIQLLKAWGAEVTTTCSTDAIEDVSQFGADHVIDYQTGDAESQLRQMPRFDLVFDTLGRETKNISTDVLKRNSGSVYVTLSTPLLMNMDAKGLIFGNFSTVSSLLCSAYTGFKEGKYHRWAVFTPNKSALEVIKGMVESEQIHPVIDRVFQFDEVPAAFGKLENGHARGKTVIEVKRVEQG